MNTTQKGIKKQVWSQIIGKIIQLYILLHSKREEEDVVLETVKRRESEGEKGMDESFSAFQNTGHSST